MFYLTDNATKAKPMNCIADLSSPHAWVRRMAEDIAKKLPTQATIDANGIMRWNSNNAVPAADMIALAVHVGLPVNAERSNAERDKETTDFFIAYRTEYTGESRENISEARAVHGAGVTLVNVITGHRFRT
jgi:hypothetical protein